MSQMIETSSATAKMIATTMPAVEIFEPELGLDTVSPELDCAGDKGGVTEGAAGTAEVDVRDDDVDAEAVLVIDVERVVRASVDDDEEDEELLLASDVLEEEIVDLLDETLVDLLVVTSALEVDELCRNAVVEVSTVVEGVMTEMAVAVGVASLIVVLWELPIVSAGWTGSAVDVLGRANTELNGSSISSIPLSMGSRRKDIL